ncbi:S41 family peptidase [Pararcticibacter amylolyticus]|uniref:Tail specific protease domain-containing protein n=1 Tax=Pararcticibacter amylolyticus TaxID=2173175 RepID=A0A2U2PJC1_9SPHI|nr:S41 family peptidase [Pararcticibacter amylolyticus]PWG81508.1 hypothetical protein DDR33_06665 [Pararcticibacter amylolyticus]
MKIRTVGPILILCCAMLIAGCRKDDTKPENPDRRNLQEDKPLSSRALATELYELARMCYLWNYPWPDKKKFGLDSLFINEYAKVAALNNELEAIKALSPNKIDKWSSLDTGPDPLQPYYWVESGDHLYQSTFGLSVKRKINGTYYIASVNVSSPAANAGLRRGWEVISVGGLPVKGTAMKDVQSKFNVNGTLNLVIRNQTGYRSLSLVKAPYVYDPIPYSGIVDLVDEETKEREKIGYMIYDSFKGDEDNLEILDQQFISFKNNGIKKIIIDLRYNSGGSNQAAGRLLDNLAGARFEGQTSYSLKLNSILWGFSQITTSPWTLEQEAFLKARKAPDRVTSLYDYLKPLWSPIKFRNINTHIFEKICFIVSKETNSASLLVINSLKPYFDNNLIIVGQDTGTKNVTTVDFSLLPVEVRDERTYDVSLVVGYFSNVNRGIVDSERGITVDNNANVGDNPAFGFGPNEPCLERALNLLD